MALIEYLSYRYNVNIVSCCSKNPADLDSSKLDLVTTIMEQLIRKREALGGNFELKISCYEEDNNQVRE